MSESLLPASVISEALGESNEEIDPELLAELQREIDRHEKAKAMVKQKEQEAIEARQRAVRSQMEVEAMKSRYVNIKERLDVSKQTLRDATLRAECRERVCKTIENLRQRAEDLLIKHQNQEQDKSNTAAKILSLANITECSEEMMLKYLNSSHCDLPMAKPDLGKTVLDLQEKLGKNQNQNQNQTQPESSQASASSTEEVSQIEDKPDGEEVLEVEQDFSQMVQRIEAKCANVREELSRMAVSEQYMRTKQAQLVAKRKEKEMIEAELRAAKKEEEAKEMKRKIDELTKLLSARKDKLKATETTLEKKSNVVEKVEKLLGRKERQASYIEKQKIDQMVFDKQVKKN